MVKKLIQQRRHTGNIQSRRHLCGRKPRILENHRSQMRDLVNKKPDITLAELRDAVGLNCMLPAIHYALVQMGLSYKKTLHASEQEREDVVSPTLGQSGSVNKAR
jgi:transposase